MYASRVGTRNRLRPFKPHTYYGGGTASEPKKLSYGPRWVREVATRYKGRITSYQIWNEANLASFFARNAGAGQAHGSR